jgi:hypothetical protein
MELSTRHKVLGAAGVTALVIGAGAAFAVSQKGGTSSGSQRPAFLNVAGNGTQPSGQMPQFGSGQMPRFRSGQMPRFGSGFGRPMNPGMLDHDALQSGIASYLGLTVNQLRTKLASGKSLAAITRAQGKTVDGLKATIVQLTKKQLDKAVAAKNLTQAQASQILSRIQSNLDRFVNRSGKTGSPGFGGGRHGGLLSRDAFQSGVASYLGLTVSQLRTKVESGDSLATIAKAQGKTVDGLKDAIVQLTKKQLDDAVAANKLTQSEASQILSNIQSGLDEIVNRSLKDGPPGGMAGPPGGMQGPPMGTQGATGTLGPPTGMPTSAPSGL